MHTKNITNSLLYEKRLSMIKIYTIGYQYVNIGGIDINRVNGTNDYLFLFLRCPTEICLHDNYEIIPENTFILFDKGAPQIYRKLDGHYINDWIHFDIEPYNDFFERLEIPFNTPISLPESKTISELISDLFIEYFNVGEQHDIIMDQKASVMFHKFSDLLRFSRQNSSKLTKYLSELIHIRRDIQNYEYCPKNVSEIAKKLNISTSYLQHLYKHFFGVSVNQDIIRGRIEHACHLLNGTNLSVTEISQICGYENLEHFSRQFKKCKGISPNNYKK